MRNFIYFLTFLSITSNFFAQNTSIQDFDTPISVKSSIAITPSDPNPDNGPYASIFYSGFSFKNRNGDSKYSISYGSFPAPGSGELILTGATFDFKATNKVLFSSGAKVGIGVRNPKNALSVNGTIWAKEIKVRLTDAADWVFEESYNLRPLTEVEEYIKENKHLPEMPSAEEFRTNDMQVSEMTNKLLQKIEELTLYTIQQHKQNEALNSRVQELEKLLLVK